MTNPTRTPTPAELRAETRGWKKAGADPATCSNWHRHQAAWSSKLADDAEAAGEGVWGLRDNASWHNALADEWDRIAAREAARKPA